MIENLLVCINAILPIFLIMGIGYLARRMGIIDKADIEKFNKAAFHVFVPFLIFYNVYSFDFSSAFSLKTILYIVLAVFAQCLLAMLFCHFYVKRFDCKSVVIQALFRASYTTLGIPLAKNLFGESALGPFALLLPIVVLQLNIMSVIILEIYSGKKDSPERLLTNIITNPLIVGAVLGLLFKFLPIRLPVLVDSMVSDMAKVATPLLMFLLGAFFNFKIERENMGYLTAICLARLIIFPLIVLSIAYLIGIRGPEFVAVIGVCATAVAPNSFSMIQQMGGNMELAGDSVVVTGALSPFTVFLWCFLFKSLQCF